MPQEILSHRGISFQVWDLSQPTPSQEIQPGYYYTFPIDQAELVHPAEVVLAGPYPTRDAAVSEAHGFINDALTEFETQES